MSISAASHHHQRNSLMPYNVASSSSSSTSSSSSKLTSLTSSSTDSNNNETMLPPMTTVTIQQLINPNQSSPIRSLVELADNKLLNHGDLLGPIPNLFKWLQSELTRVEKQLETSFMMKNSPNTLVELALIKEEQNLEIVFYNEQYYFEVVRSFRVQQQQKPQTDESMKSSTDHQFSEEKPKAWFCKEIEERLLLTTTITRPAQTWLNGKELFCCLMCNHFSFYFNHIILHTMFDCPKKAISTTPTTATINITNNSQELDNQRLKRPPTPSPMDNMAVSPNKKQIRSFDIQSLLNNNHNNHNNDPSPTYHYQPDDDIVDVVSENNQDEEVVDVESLDIESGSNLEEINNFKSSMMINNNISPQQQQQQHPPSRIGIKQQQRTMMMDIIQRQFPSQAMMQQQQSLPVPPGIINAGGKPERKYNSTRRYNNKKLNMMTNTAGQTNNNKSAFRKLKNQNNKCTNKLSPTNGIMNNQLPSNQFISNPTTALNLSQFYNQLQQQQIDTNGSTTTNGTNQNNPLFPFVSNLFRSGTTSIPPSFTPSSPPAGSYANTNGNNPKSNGPKVALSSPPSTSFTNPMIFDPHQPCSSSSSSNMIHVNTIENHQSEASSSSSSSPSLTSHTSSPSNSPGKNGSKKGVEKGRGDEEPSSIQLLPPGAQSSMANNPLFNLPPYFMPPTTTAASNPLITSLYLLSPSLTALSYQASNVCAYCNTAFRMTSDLVYHMRSHHKRTKAAEDLVNKKRRDDQLRCHICQETFRERHHLTRHMTSHQ